MCSFYCIMKRLLTFLRSALIFVALLVLTGSLTSCSSNRVATVIGERSMSKELPSNAAPPPTERPGLATGWGENKASAVIPQAFRRKPGSMRKAVVYYNDKEGAETLKGKRIGLFATGVMGPHYQHPLTLKLTTPLGIAYHSVNAEGKRIFIGKPGKPYVITLRNRVHRPIEAVVSVDGLDVIDGKAASTKKRGYIIGPSATLQIEGFRRSQHEVAQFEFSSVDGSYANKTGGAAAALNVGVIGVATFEEENEELNIRKAADAFPAFAQPPTP